MVGHKFLIAQSVRVIGCFCSLLLLAGCGGIIKGDIQRVHTLPADVSGRSFYVFPDSSQQGTPEFALYAQDIAANLTQHGMLEVASFDDADYIVQFRYSVGGGRQETSTYSRTTGGEFVTGTGMVTTGPAAGQTFQYEGQRPFQRSSESVTSTVYDRILELDIADREKSMAQESGVYVYNARVVSDGRSANFMTVSRCLFDFLLKDFPGHSGSTESFIEFGESCER